ncbi:hypothetical protein [Saccharothrix syringae]|uniref:hypothetical protein n=1 Tax=Saccharothrix syringae TaxID=103733 RepID=UPI000AC265D1|nr:hypothetical protein [Saccharothrix syringae]
MEPNEVFAGLAVTVWGGVPYQSYSAITDATGRFALRGEYLPDRRLTATAAFDRRT